MDMPGPSPDPAPDPERMLALSYVPAGARAGVAALFALDSALAGVLRTTHEPAIAQIRMAWWRERLAALDTTPPPAMPVLEALADHVVGPDISGAALVTIVEGWEVLIEHEALSPAAMIDYATARGATLFALANRLSGATDGHARAGEGWALSDLSRHLADRDAALVAAQLAADRLSTGERFDRAARGMGALALLARLDLAVPFDRAIPTGAPSRIARMLRMRFTGRA